MKLFKKVLSMLLSFSVILTFGFLANVFADTPKNLEECCIELDKICSPEEKERIKQTSEENWSKFIGEILPTPLGRMIMANWLYSVDDETEVCKENELAKLLLAHGANHWGVAHVVMTSMVLEYYNHYLNGKTVASIEDLVVDHWFSHEYYTCKNSALTKQQLKRSMETGIPISFGIRENWPMRCTIL